MTRDRYAEALILSAALATLTLGLQALAEARCRLRGGCTASASDCVCSVAAVAGAVLGEDGIRRVEKCSVWLTSVAPVPTVHCVPQRKVC